MENLICAHRRAAAAVKDDLRRNDALPCPHATGLHHQHGHWRPWACHDVGPVAGRLATNARPSVRALKSRRVFADDNSPATVADGAVPGHTACGDLGQTCSTSTIGSAVSPGQPPGPSVGCQNFCHGWPSRRLVEMHNFGTATATALAGHGPDQLQLHRRHYNLRAHGGGEAEMEHGC
jgi:hypothetical protein